MQIIKSYNNGYGREILVHVYSCSEEIRSGYFHQWVVDLNGDLYAIIERDTGKIERVYYDLVEFVDQV